MNKKRNKTIIIIMITLLMILMTLLLTQVRLANNTKEFDITFENLGTPGKEWELTETFFTNNSQTRIYTKNTQYNELDFNKIIENVSHETIENMKKSELSNFESSCVKVSNSEICEAKFTIVFAGKLGEKHINISMNPELGELSNNNKTYTTITVLNQ